MPGPASEKPSGGGRRSHRFPRFAGMLSALLGILAVIGWHAHWAAIVGIFPNDAPMPYDAACCLILSGVGLLALTTRYRRLSPWLGGIVTVFAVLVLAEFAAGV